MTNRDSDAEYEIESIVGDRLEGRKRLFRVCWLGYPESDSSWEPESSLKRTAPEALQEYLDSKKSKRGQQGSILRNGNGDTRSKSSDPAPNPTSHSTAIKSSLFSSPNFWVNLPPLRMGCAKGRDVSRLASLPPEILDNIFAQLFALPAVASLGTRSSGLQSLTLVSRVCRLWMALAQRRLLRKLVVKSNFQVVRLQTPDFIDSGLRHFVREVVLEFSPHYGLESRSLFVLLPLFPNITSLTIKVLTEYPTLRVQSALSVREQATGAPSVSSFRNLQTLNIRPIDLFDTTDLHSILSAASSLTEIGITFEQGEVVTLPFACAPIHLPRLSRLRITGSRAPTSILALFAPSSIARVLELDWRLDGRSLLTDSVKALCDLAAQLNGPRRKLGSRNSMDLYHNLKLCNTNSFLSMRCQIGCPTFSGVRYGVVDLAGPVLKKLTYTAGDSDITKALLENCLVLEEVTMLCRTDTAAYGRLEILPSTVQVVSVMKYVQAEGLLGERGALSKYPPSLRELRVLGDHYFVEAERAAKAKSQRLIKAFCETAGVGFSLLSILEVLEPFYYYVLTSPDRPKSFFSSVRSFSYKIFLKPSAKMPGLAFAQASTEQARTENSASKPCQIKLFARGCSQLRHPDILNHDFGVVPENSRVRKRSPANPQEDNTELEGYPALLSQTSEVEFLNLVTLTRFLSVEPVFLKLRSVTVATFDPSDLPWLSGFLANSAPNLRALRFINFTGNEAALAKTLSRLPNLETLIVNSITSPKLDLDVPHPSILSLLPATQIKTIRLPYNMSPAYLASLPTSLISMGFADASWLSPQAHLLGELEQYISNISMARKRNLQELENVVLSSWAWETLERRIYDPVRGMLRQIGEGIGLSTSLLFASLGAFVTIGDLSPPLAGSVPSSIHFHRTNCTSYASLLSLFRASETKFGKWPDVVFANAGIGERGHMFEAAEDDNIEVEPRHEVTELDLKAVANTVRIAFWGMRKSGNGGNVVMTASVAGYTGQPGLPMYNASKHAVVGLLRALRFSAPRDKIAISLVAPAITATAILASASQTQQSTIDGLVKAGVPINTPERVAEAVVYMVAKGQKANGMGLMVQKGLVMDLEKGIAKNRRHWMGAEMEGLYRSGTGFNVFEKIGEGGGMGTGEKL
ncbi:hypothetical protein P7C70_g3787, partial [Phenoliferia sp. Uapishka_3]